MNDVDASYQRARSVKYICNTIINVLSQIEEIEKKLFEKKKIVLETNYVITLDRIRTYAGDGFLNDILEEILHNEKQLEEWKELFGIKIQTLNDLYTYNLPIDTKYFDNHFKFHLLEKLTEKNDLDDILDGILIKSDNYQALNTILPKFKGKIKTIYIDPPYNTGSDGFKYEDNFETSSYLTMLENRLTLAKDLLNEEGVIFLSIANSTDKYFYSYDTGEILKEIFPKRLCDFVWKRRNGSGSYSISNATETHEYIYAFGKSQSYLKENVISRHELAKYTNKDDKGLFKWNSLVINQYTKEQRPNLYYGVVYNFLENKLLFDEDLEKLDPTCETVIYPSKDGSSVFVMTKKSMEEVYYRGDISVVKTSKGYQIVAKKYLSKDGNINGQAIKSVLEDNQWLYDIKGTTQATKELKDLFGYDLEFKTAKPVDLIMLLLWVTTDADSFILDFFAGSGTTAHAVMKLNKEDGGRRKFILIEMADYFDTVIIPRIKKVAYSFNWKDGKPQDKDGIGIFFKYHTLEQYEDTINNTIHQGSNSVKYINPFSYTLKVRLSEVSEPQEVVVDIPETFNYLLGLKVKKIKARENNGKRYIFTLGEKDGKNIVVVFREFSDEWSKEDFKRDEEFVMNEISQWNPDVIYINDEFTTSSSLGEVRYIEPEFEIFF